ncbi:helicase domain-containing protein [Rhizoctonia solani AG-1 IA]|uniref:RNA helicase n=1 Tax=Thanatephorus cucumeris (strain AG1-IA) TaxID=983506 RepID=L8WY87_THACA|nr:helicase domain-containing protein [Rhizoctonia solani AG-1 IA]
MAKKKKLSLKPVARQVATTSIAKKVTEKPPEEEEQEAEIESQKQDSKIPEETQKVDEEYDIDRAEIESLQLLVDQQQAKAEREALRVIKALEQDSRASKTLPRLDIDPSIRDRILELIRAVEPSSRLIQEPEVKVLPRLAVVYGTLRGLGLTEKIIEECLKVISDIDIDSAIEWLILWAGLNNGGSEILPPYGATEIPQPAPQPAPSAPATRPANTPTRLATPAADVSLSDSDSDGSLEVDVNTKWARTKVQLHMLKFGKPKSFKLNPNDPKVQKLEARIRTLESDYEFRKKHAEYSFQQLRRVAEDDELKRSLKAPKAALPAKGTDIEEAPKESGLLEKPADSTPVGTNLIDQHSDSDEGGFFGHMLDEMPTEVTTAAGDIVRVHPLEFPKSWNQATPKSLLKEYVNKIDSYALASYRPIGGVTRVARAAVQVRWRSKPGQEWIIPDACPTLTQAEEYAALLALHSLSSPVRAGFVGLRSTIVPVQPSSIRSLPPSAQSLWREFETRRKYEEDEANRKVWATLRTILEPKLSPPGTYKVNTPNCYPIIDDYVLSQMNQTVKSATSAAQDSSSATKSKAPLREVPSLRNDFEARRASPAYQEMLQKRNDLPIASFRSQIIQSLQDNQVIVLSGETGCGKSTQLPAYIMEDQLSHGLPCRIYCTEPRRISAISLAQRVSRELGEPPNAVGTMSSLIGYSVRLESNITRNTRLAFVTNGIALRMLESDGKGGTAFDEITHIIIDEVHERSIESDFLLIVLKSMMKHRPDLKIVLMSATVDAEKVSAYFGGPNVCPVALTDAYPEPSVLSRSKFNTLKMRLNSRIGESMMTLRTHLVCHHQSFTRVLSIKRHAGNKAFARTKSKKLEWSEETAIAEDEDEENLASATPVKLGKQYTPSTISTIVNLDERRIPYDLILRLLEKICLEDSEHSNYSAAVLVFLPGLNEIRQLTDILGAHRDFGTHAFRIYPLHSSLPSESQTAVFEIPPPGIRKIVISTNIAETGVTIPVGGLIAAKLTCKHRFDEKRQTSRLIETTIEPMLITYFQMVDNPLPEILRLSLADLALRIKIMNIQIGSSVEDVLTRALDPPSSTNIQRAVNALIEVNISATSHAPVLTCYQVKALTTTEQITNLGRLLSKLPMDVHLGKFLGCLDSALTICATLNAKSPFLKPFGFEAQADAAKLSFAKENSDFFALVNAFNSWKRALSNGQHVARKFCRESYLSYQVIPFLLYSIGIANPSFKNLQQIEDLRQQFMGYLIDSSFVSVDAEFSQEFKRLRFQRQRTKIMQLPESISSPDVNVGLIEAALTAGMFPKIISIDSSTGHMQTIGNNRPVAFHPSSVNFKRALREFKSSYLCYFSLMQVAPVTRQTLADALTNVSYRQAKKLYASETGPASDLSLILLCGDCEFKPSSELVVVDRKLKYRVPGKTLLALKALKGRLASNMAVRLRPKQTETASETDLWSTLALELFRSPIKLLAHGTHYFRVNASRSSATLPIGPVGLAKRLAAPSSAEHSDPIRCHEQSTKGSDSTFKSLNPSTIGLTNMYTMPTVCITYQILPVVKHLTMLPDRLPSGILISPGCHLSNVYKTTGISSPSFPLPTSAVPLTALPALALAGDIKFFPEKDCGGTPSHEYDVVSCGTCITPPDESSAALVNNVSNRHLVTVYNSDNCEGNSVVLENHMQNYGSLCGIQGANKIRSVLIHCIEDSVPARHRKKSVRF